jgi:hypothetical protein
MFPFCSKVNGEKVNGERMVIVNDGICLNPAASA